jgi:hypothetical protein
MHLRTLLTLFSFLMLTGDGENADPPKDDKADPPKDDVKAEFTQAQVNDLIARERKSTEERINARIAADKQREKEQRERDEAEKRGEFDTVKADLESKLTTAEQEREALQERLDKALKTIEASVKASWEAVPEEVRDLYDGDDTDALRKHEFLNKPATTKLIERLTAQAAKPGNGPNPNPAGPASKTTTDEDNRARRATRPRV